MSDVGCSGLAERAGVKGLEALNLPVVLNKPFAGADLLLATSQVLAGSFKKVIIPMV
jgi:hypothetical protein